ncbi:hypothetical protein D932_02699 [Enterococcus casseliflavus 14-MB-W-14]|nr:hypothetical protein D932_02699 [Enterococcus casseliflavus 14-MB-W-14]
MQASYIHRSAFHIEDLFFFQSPPVSTYIEARSVPSFFDTLFLKKP